jgi:hypothetical protein
MGHGGNVTDELTTDHREAGELFGKIEALPSGHQDRKLYADQVTRELVRHSVAEEAYLCPAVPGTWRARPGTPSRTGSRRSTPRPSSS